MSKKRKKCGGKICYETKRSAKKAHRKSADRLRFYPCPVCKHWHATNRDRRSGFVRPKRREAPYGTGEWNSAMRAKGRKISKIFQHPGLTPKDPKKHSFVPFGETPGCFVCGMPESMHVEEGSEGEAA